MRSKRTAILILFVALVAGCISPVTDAMVPAPATPIPAGTVPSLQPAPGEAAALARTVRDLFVASLGYELLAADAPGPGVNGVAVIPVERAGNVPLAWIAHTVGLRDFMAPQNHTLALYEQVGPDTVAELARVELVDAGDGSAFAPDYLGEGTVQQVMIEPEGLWFTAEGGVGAHSGVFGLYRFAGGALTQQVVAFNSSPGVGVVTDVNNDGVGEVITSATEHYVFCYACGVRIPAWQLWRWNGEAMEEVTFAPLPGDPVGSLPDANAALLAFAGANLWLDADATIMQAMLLSSADPTGTFEWNVHLAQLQIDATRAETELPEHPYPLLAQLFFGDYAAAVDLMRAWSAAEIFSADSSLIVETVASGWEETLANWLETYTTSALEVKPDLAEAYFLRAWANFLVGRAGEAAVDATAASTLAPADPLFAEAAALLAQ